MRANKKKEVARPGDGWQNSLGYSWLCVSTEKNMEENPQKIQDKIRNFLHCDVIISDSDKQTKETR